MTKHYLEDFAVGQTFNSGNKRVEKDEIFAFAKEFDPQPYHLDEKAAQQSVFRGLAASGWHTAAMTMRLMVDGEFRPAEIPLGISRFKSGFFGRGRWPTTRRAAPCLAQKSAPRRR